MLVFFTLVGIYAVAYYLYDNLRTPLYLLYHKWQQHNGLNQNLLMQRYGKWVAITGATDGIGKALARELARLGFNIVLISRTETKLQQVAHEIETEFGTETFIVQCDFSKGKEVYENLLKKLEERPIGILINNVGIGHNPPGTISTFSPEHIWDVINVNIGAATLLSRHFIDKWHKTGVRGHIINVSSGLGFHPCPFASVYAASKAYMNSLTRTLQEETKNLGITVQLLTTYFVVTKINSYSKFIMKGNILMPQVDKYAKSAVKTLGIVDETSGYFWHGIKIAVQKALPWQLTSFVFKKIAVSLIENLNDIGAKCK